MDSHLTTIGFFLVHGRHRTHDEQAQRAAYIAAIPDAGDLPDGLRDMLYGDDLHDNDFGGDFEFIG